MGKRTWVATAVSTGVLGLGAVLLATPLAGRPAEAAGDAYALQEAWSNVTFEAPTDLGAPKDGSDRVFVVERAGKVKVLRKPRGAGAGAAPATFLDVSSLLTPAPQEQGHGGLCSIAFHPDYAKNGRFFVFYGTGSGTEQDPYRSVVAGYRQSATNPDAADPASGQIILSVPKPKLVHFGGGLCFGRDGTLYVGIGDTATENDPDRVAQDPRTLEGKILGLDVNGTSPGKNYAIPAGNPWPKGEGGVRPEIFAYGVRNPWRISCDRTTGLLWMGDPGQKKREEIDVIPRGGNLGWAMMEGDQPLAPDAKPSAYVAPVYAYGREAGRCVIGGTVYRGQRCSGLTGKYVFADHMAGKLWALPIQGDKAAGAPEPLPDCEACSAIEEDAQGELYFVSLDAGKVFILVPAS